ncbi:hypothetical protein B9479_000022 [Cryptococcus floricola]|uniref:Uncharacterized protein n=1 Tax=Cryptococcus floricola TaxID=2591691 RepID=A0A5D3BAA0_9TREE|nr:hypothetical protein B9479_000022 [Cryptococcus floricola]
MSAPLRPLATLSRPLLRRAYAAPAGGNPNLVHPSDSRSDMLKQMLYPPDSYAPTSSSPVGTYHPDHLERLRTVIPSAEAYETIERAWQLYQREQREERKVQLKAKYESMVEACDELERITRSEGEDANGGLYHRQVYDLAVAQLTQAKRRGEQPKGKKTAEQKWLETRVEGLVPRESWVPVESRGKGWNYDWQRPGK